MRHNGVFPGDWLVVFILLGAAGLAARQPALVGIGALVLLAWGLARLWDRLALTRVSYHRSLSQNRAFPGERIELRLHIANRKTLPLPWVQIRDEISAELLQDPTTSPQLPAESRAHLERSTSLSWHEEVTWNVPLFCHNRGVYTFGPAQVQSGDIFGFFRREMSVSNIDRLVIYPQVVELPEIGIPPGKPFGDVRGGSPLFEDPTRTKGLRDYQPDDPWKRVDWKATAHRGRLQVRVYEPTVTHSLLVLLNGATSARSGRVEFSRTLLERAVTVAASVAAYAFEERFSVGLLTNAHSLLSDVAIKILPSRAPHHLAAILEALATVGPLSSSSLEDLLWGQVHQLPIGATLAVVTAVLPQTLLDTLLDLRRLGYRLTILWVGDTPIPSTPEGGVQVFDVGRHLANIMWRRDRGEKQVLGRDVA